MSASVEQTSPQEEATSNASEGASDAGGPKVIVTREAVEFARRKSRELGMTRPALRIGVKGGGCAGLTYVTEYTEAPPTDRDLVYEFYGLPVFVDQRSLRFIEGTTLRYENTLMHQGFKFENPLQASTCGCGHTFSVKKELKTLR